MTVDDLKRLLGVIEDQDLAPHFGLKDRSTISKWRTRPEGRVPAHIERKALEMSTENDKRPTNAGLPWDEKMLLENYRKLTGPEKAKLLQELTAHGEDSSGKD